MRGMWLYLLACDQVHIPTGGEDEPDRDERLALDRCGQDLAGYLKPGAGRR
jgi:hypothetical protein